MKTSRLPYRDITRRRMRESQEGRVETVERGTQGRDANDIPAILHLVYANYETGMSPKLMSLMHVMRWFSAYRRQPDQRICCKPCCLEDSTLRFVLFQGLQIGSSLDLNIK